MDIDSIYTTLKTIINKENIIEVSFVPTKGEGDYKPFLYIENCLGIPLPIVPKTLEFLKKKFVGLRKDITVNFKEIDYCTQCILLLNGEYITAWNERKNLIKLGYLEPKYDLYFTKLCLTKHPKSSNLWYHRQWILKHFNELIKFENEFEIIEKAINRYATNYFAWNHKIWLLDYMDKIQLTKEFLEMQTKMYKYISDHAGWNYLLAILRKRLAVTSKKIDSDGNGNTHKSIDVEDQKEWCRLLQEHRQQLRHLMIEFPGHESLWNYLRLFTGFLFRYSKILGLDRDNDNNNEGDNHQGSDQPLAMKSLWAFYEEELAFLRDRYLGEASDSNTLLVEEKYAIQYKLWLYTLQGDKVTTKDVSALGKELEEYQCLSGDTSVEYLKDLFHCL